METNRREFLQQFTATTACLLCGSVMSPLLNSCESPTDQTPSSSVVPLTSGDPVISLASESGLKDVGGAVKKRFSAINGGGIIIVVRLSTSNFAAYSARCTHQGGEINLPVSGVMTCPNHGSKFNASDGNVVQGPAASPLSKFTATYDNSKNTVTIS